MQRHLAVSEHTLTAASAESDAMQVLEATWRDLDASNALPVDPVQIATDLGIQVFAADLSTNESGSLVNKPGADPVMYVNRYDSLNRQRFICAHEIGHYIKRVNAGDTQFSFRDKRDTLSTQGSDPDEVYANQFAAALLMPERQLRAAFEKSPNAAVLAFRFGVSSQAMTWRLTNLGLV